MPYPPHRAHPVGRSVSGRAPWKLLHFAHHVSQAREVIRHHTGSFRMPSRRDVARIRHVKVVGEEVWVEHATDDTVSLDAVLPKIPQGHGLRYLIAGRVGAAITGALEEWSMPTPVLGPVSPRGVRLRDDGVVVVEGFGLWSAVYSCAQDKLGARPVLWAGDAPDAARAGPTDAAEFAIFAARLLLEGLPGIPRDVDGLRAYLNRRGWEARHRGREAACDASARAMLEAMPGLAGLMGMMPSDDGDLEDDPVGQALGRVLHANPDAERAEVWRLLADGLHPEPSHRPTVCDLAHGLIGVARAAGDWSMALSNMARPAPRVDEEPIAPSWHRAVPPPLSVVYDSEVA